MKSRFRVLNTSLKGLELETEKNLVRVGRASDNDLVLQQHSVSRYHAVLVIRDGKLFVEDAGSRNQTQVDGQTVFHNLAIKSGAVISFGDVLVEASFSGETEPGVEDAEATPAGGVAVDVAQPPAPAAIAVETGPSAAPAAAQTPPQPAAPPAAVPAWLAAPVPAEIREVAASKALERQLWPILTLILGVAAAVVMIVFFLRSGGGSQTPVGEYGVCLHVGEKRVVQVPWGFVNKAHVDPPDIVEVDRPIKVEVAMGLTARSQGLATVTLYDAAGRHIALYVRVLARAKENVQKLLEEDIRSRDERIRRAREDLMRASVLREQDELYAAMQQCAHALLVMEPDSASPPPEYLQAMKTREELDAEIEERYKNLTTEVSDLLRDGDKGMALRRLEEAKGLVSDEEDVRWQSCDLLSAFLKDLIKREKERSRRGL